MRAKDDPATRIKAADAKNLWWTSARERPALLERLARGCGFQFLTLIQVQDIDDAWTVTTWAETDRSREIAQDYFEPVIRSAPGEVLERSGTLLFGVHQDGMAEVATYGVSQTDCHHLGGWGAEKLKEMTAVPFQTWFGWGYDGTPTPLTEEQLETLTPQGRAWVADRTRVIV